MTSEHLPVMFDEQCFLLALDMNPELLPLTSGKQYLCACMSC